MTDRQFALEVARAAAEQIDRHPPHRLVSYSLRLEARELVITFRLTTAPGQRFGYRIEALPEDPSDRGSAGAWAGIVVANFKEAVEAEDAPPANFVDADGILWLPT